MKNIERYNKYIETIKDDYKYIDNRGYRIWIFEIDDDAENQAKFLFWCGYFQTNTEYYFDGDTAVCCLVKEKMNGDRLQEMFNERGKMSDEELKDKIGRFFNDYKHQKEVYDELLKMVFPHWEHIENISGYPKVGSKLSDYIWEKFIEFDKEHHPGVQAGGLWLNCGFSGYGNEDLGDWEISLIGCSCELK